MKVNDGAVPNQLAARVTRRGCGGSAATARA